MWSLHISLHSCTAVWNFYQFSPTFDVDEHMLSPLTLISHFLSLLLFQLINIAMRQFNLQNYNHLDTVRKQTFTFWTELQSNRKSEQETEWWPEWVVNNETACTSFGLRRCQHSHNRNWNYNIQDIDMFRWRKFRIHLFPSKSSIKCPIRLSKHSLQCPHGIRYICTKKLLPCTQSILTDSVLWSYFPIKNLPEIP